MGKRSKSVQNCAGSFFRSLSGPEVLLDLFDQLPDIYMYIKDLESRFVRANQVVCDVVGATNACELVGRTDFDFFPPAIAAQYVAEDQRVITSGSALFNQVWLVPGKNGVPRLYLCNKLPLYDSCGEIIGIAGIKRPYEHSADDSAGYHRLTRVVAFVTENFGEDLEVADVAAHVGISASQLQREFSKKFGITPVRYIREVRIGVARHMLIASDASLSRIATECGFYDQSHFNRHFKDCTGLTPLKYRQRFR